MKIIALVLGILIPFTNDAGSKVVESKVYSFSRAKIEKTASGGKRELVSGKTTHLAKFEITASTLLSGKASPAKRSHSDCEEIIFIREGELKVSIGDASKTMSAGSVALIMPGDGFMVENSGKSNATYYLIKYQSNRPMDLLRGKNGGGSMLLSWDSIQFKPHDKGGIRRFFDRKSAMSDRIEMHATTLNPAIKSHEPHTHLPDEIVIMMEGTTEMEIGDGIFPCKPGDVYFLGSNIPHAIRNTGDKPCMYLAFQWE